MPRKALSEPFVDALKDAHDAERQLRRALPTMARIARDTPVKWVLRMHLEETDAQIDRLEDAFKRLGRLAAGRHSEGMAAIIREVSAVAELDPVDGLLDERLLGAVQRAGRYRIGLYATLRSWAGRLGHTSIAELLEASLLQAQTVNARLTNVAEDMTSANGSLTGGPVMP